MPSCQQAGLIGYLLRSEICGHCNFPNPSSLCIRESIYECSFGFSVFAKELIEVFGGEIRWNIGNSERFAQKWIWIPWTINRRFRRPGRESTSRRAGEGSITRKIHHLISQWTFTLNRMERTTFTFTLFALSLGCSSLVTRTYVPRYQIDITMRTKQH